MAKPDWRKIEAVLVAVAKSYGYEVLTANNSGDKIADDMLWRGDDFPDGLNLTELAKELEDRL